MNQLAMTENAEARGQSANKRFDCPRRLGEHTESVSTGVERAGGVDA